MAQLPHSWIAQAAERQTRPLRSRAPNGGRQARPLRHLATTERREVHDQPRGHLKPGDVVIHPRRPLLYKERQENLSKDDPVGHCNLAGRPTDECRSLSLQDHSALRHGGHPLLRSAGDVPPDFHPRPRVTENPNPTLDGVLSRKVGWRHAAVESGGFNDKAWIDSGGHPHSDALHVTERFHRRDFGTSIFRSRSTIRKPT